MERKWLVSALIIIVLGVLLFPMETNLPKISAANKIQDVNKIITVTGESEIKTVPDVVFINFTVETMEKTAEDALVKNKLKMKGVIDHLKQKGLKPEDIQTVRFSIEPQWNYVSKTTDFGEEKLRTLTGYRAINTVLVRSEDVEGIGRLIDEIVSCGANQVGNIKFSIKNSQELEQKALKLAVDNARKKAEALASAAGTKITGVISIREIGSFNYALQGYRGYGAKYKISTPIEPGQIFVSSRVEVVFSQE